MQQITPSLLCIMSCWLGHPEWHAVQVKVGIYIQAQLMNMHPQGSELRQRRQAGQRVEAVAFEEQAFEARVLVQAPDLPETVVVGVQLVVCGRRQE